MAAGGVLRDQKKALKMSDFGNSSPNPNPFAELSWRQLSFDFDLDAVACDGDEVKEDDDGHIPYCDDLPVRRPPDHVAASEGSHKVSFRPFIHLCTADGVQRLKSATDAKPKNDDLAQRDRLILKKLQAQHGCVRPLKPLSSTWRSDLDALERGYNNFSEAFSYVRAMCSLAEFADGVVVLDPILLHGEPGSGKSTVVEELASIVAGGYHRLSMSAAETGSQIGGSASSWSNSTLGAVFDSLVHGAWGNPLFLLDELDRASVEGRYSPLGPLYQLLEPAMALRFQDLSVPSLQINASRVIWIATANLPNEIPEPLRQRMVQFAVLYPCGRERYAVARSVMHRLTLVEPTIARFSLSPEAVEVLIKYPPRVMRRLLRLACGIAIQNARFELIAADFPAVVSQKRVMGFCG